MKGLANLCRDDDGKLQFADSYLSVCDLSNEARKAIQINLRDAGGNSLIARSDDKLQQIYAKLRSVDEADGSLDGVIKTGESVEIEFKNTNEKNISVRAEEAKMSVVSIKLTFARGAEKSGTAFIVKSEKIEEDGRIFYRNTAWTAGHVVDEEYEEEKGLEAALFDGTEVNDVKIAGVDHYIDFAVIKFETDKELPALEINGAARLTMMTEIMTLGNRLNEGVVSIRGEVVNVGIDGGVSYIGDIIKISDASTYGDSGGPVINKDGKVVGILFRVEKSSAGRNLSMAIPIARAKASAEKIERRGFAEYGDAGFVPEILSNSVSRALGIESRIQLIFVRQSLAGAKTGLKNGDILIALDGDDSLVNQITNETKLYLLDDYWLKKNPNRAVKMTVFRDGKKLDIEVTLEKIHHNSPKAWQTPYGFTAVEITKQIRNRLAMEDAGVLVVSDDKERYTSYGLPNYSIITHIGTTRVRSLDEFTKTLAEAEKASGGTLIFKAVNTEQSPRKTGLVEYASVPVQE